MSVKNNPPWRWWHTYGLFPPEDSEEAYPTPHAVLEAYRIQAHVELVVLAQELGISEQMIRRIFHKGATLDSVARRRKMVHRLSIPPQLLGLDPLFLERTTASDPWWVAEYHSFTAGDDGYPVPGQVIRWYREQKEKRLPDRRRGIWTQYDVGQVCDPPLSERSVNKMEKYGIGLDSMSRRRAFAFLLGIPPALLGLDSPQGVAAALNPVSLIIPTKLTPEVITGYEQHHQSLLLEYFQQHGQNAVGEAIWCISNLQDILLPLATTHAQHMSVRVLEQRYHRFIIDVAREQRNNQLLQYHSTAFLGIAEELQDTEHLVVALHFRASALRHMGFYEQAQTEIDRALQLINNSGKAGHALTPGIVGSVFMTAGLIHSYTAQLEGERVVARSLLERGIKLAEQANNHEDTHLLKLTPGYAHLYAAQALVLRNNPAPMALQEHIDEATRLTDPMLQRRTLMLTIVKAQQELIAAKKTIGVVQDAHYAEATTLAIDAVQVAKVLKSDLNKSRVQSIYAQLLECPYKGEPSVAKLGLLLRHWKTSD